MERFWIPPDPDDPRVAVIFDDVIPEGWEVWVFVASEHGRPIVHEIRIAPVRTGTPYRAAPKGGLTTRDRRFLNVDKLRLRAFRAIVNDIARKEDLPDWRRDVAIWETVEAAVRKIEDAPRSERRRRTPAFYAHAAASYVRHAHQGGPVYGAMRDQDYPYYHDDTLRDVIKECRKQGYLTAAPKGRAGGQLTDKTIQILKRTDKEEGGGS